MTDSQRKFSCSLIYFQTSTKPWVSRCILSRSISRTRFLRVSVITHRAISDQVNLIICVIGATRTPHTGRQDAHRHDPPRSTKLIEPKWLWLGSGSFWLSQSGCGSAPARSGFLKVAVARLSLVLEFPKLLSLSSCSFWLSQNMVYVRAA